MFANTKIKGYHKDFLANLKELKNVSYLFAQSNITNQVRPESIGSIIIEPREGTLQKVFLTDDYVNTSASGSAIYSNLFYGLTKINDISGLFAGCSEIKGFVDNEGHTLEVMPKEFLDPFRDTLENASSVFLDTKLECDFNNEFFKNSSKLKNVARCFANTNLTGRINEGNSITITPTIQPEDFDYEVYNSGEVDLPQITYHETPDIFKGCSVLENTSYLFYNCSSFGFDNDFANINKTILPSNIFDDCRSTISNTSYMFTNSGLTGKLESGVAHVYFLKAMEADGITYSLDENDNYIRSSFKRINVLQNGLFANCTNLSTCAYMFSGCMRLHGNIPDDMFYTSSGLTLFNVLTDVSGLFDKCYSLLTVPKDSVIHMSDIGWWDNIYDTQYRGPQPPNNWIPASE
jgi:hypothetical protein